MAQDLSRKIKHKSGVVVYRVDESGLMEVLLISSRKYKGTWVFPVGTVEDHETLQVAAARECEEESGYIVEIESEVGTVTVEENDHLNYFTFFRAKVIDETDQYEVDRERKWVKISELENFIAKVFLPITHNFINNN